MTVHIHKKNKTSEEPKKEYYIVDVEGFIPAKARFRVLAENEDEAFKLFETRPDQCFVIHPPQPMPGKIQPKKISIRHYMSSLIKWMRKF